VPEVGGNRMWIDSDRLKNLPPIVFLSMAARPGLVSVAIDNRYGARQAVQHLIAQGRKRIGLITGPLAWWEARERYAGWQEMLCEHGLEPTPSLVIEGDWSAASGAHAMSTLLEREPTIDAVFVCSDQMAQGALGVAHRSGRHIPQDLAIVGFDNIPESEFFWPPLTTVYQNLIDAGCVAVQKLHFIIEAQRKEEPYSVEATILTPELVIRESSATGA
jgi:LacI family transcriptional regulator